tara:strand:- start:976 stop:1521 length:546 start_codon:yes stop_codon:yes gene_type:complete
MFSAPIPGQSLTSEPKNSPWENPPQMNKPEEAVLWHLKKLDKPKSIKSVIGLLGLGLDLVTLTEGLLRGAVAEGRHSIDVSLLIAPVIHEYIKGIADASGVEYNEGLDDDEEELDLNIVALDMREREAEKIIQEYKDKGTIDMSELEPAEDVEVMEDEPMQVEEEPMEEDMPMGLMARRNV